MLLVTSSQPFLYFYLYPRSVATKYIGFVCLINSDQMTRANDLHVRSGDHISHTPKQFYRKNRSEKTTLEDNA
jgi:hypothetical protein